MASLSEPLAEARDVMRSPTLPVLSRALLSDASWRAPSNVRVPSPAMLELRERAVQFGTGAFLRGFVDSFIDSSNANGRFNGRIVAIGSTGSGRDVAFTAQDGLYTLVSAGSNSDDNETRIVASVSRAINASLLWSSVLEVARDPRIAFVFSNTTEAGFALDERDKSAIASPHSFPARLTRFLIERARLFLYDAKYGVTVVPCELIEDNGSVLRELVLQCARDWNAEQEFFAWIDAAVPFCNTLVDRIVPGSPPAAMRAELESSLGYSDALLTMAEPYRLFVIEADQRARKSLAFLEDEAGVVLTDDVRVYRERKLRLLNGTHTGIAAVGILAGLETVNDCMRDQSARLYAQLLLDGIVPMVDAPDAEQFGTDVLKRFANPNVFHRLADIVVQGTLKLRVRLLPIVERYTDAGLDAPRPIATAFAAQLLLWHPVISDSLRMRLGALPGDSLAERVTAHWKSSDDVAGAVHNIFADTSLIAASPALPAKFVREVANIATEILGGGMNALLHREMYTPSRVVVA